MHMVSSQKRRFPRAPFNGSLAVCQGREATLVAAVDVGGGGVRFRTDAALAARSVVTLRVVLPGATAGLTVLGKVVRRAETPQGAEVAVEFLDLLPTQRERILAHVASGATAGVRAAVG